MDAATQPKTIREFIQALHEGLVCDRCGRYVGSLGEERHCLLGRPHCSDRTACAAHAKWKLVADRVAEFFRETTIAELLQGAAVPA